MVVEIILAILAVSLGVLLIIRQRQLHDARPVDNLEQVLDGLKHNFVANRTEGKIQIVASELSDILINRLQSQRILFFRKQRRFMELNYVYGLKSLQRGKFRIKISNALMQKLMDGELILRPSDLTGMIGDDLTKLLEAEQFNIVFPIFWRDNLFGVYFISTELPVDHPLVNTLLLFLNQNLSTAYHITRLESTRQILENKIESQRRKVRDLEHNRKAVESKSADDDPGHLIEMFGHRNVDELMGDLFDKVRAGLKADKLIFISHPARKDQEPIRYSRGLDRQEFDLNDAEFQRVFGSLPKSEVGDVEKLGDILSDGRLRDDLTREQLRHISRFSLSDGEQGLLFWSGKKTGEKVEARFLSRLEQVARKAMTNAREFQRVEAMSYTDGLTGLYNHRYFVKRLHEEIQRAKRYQRQFGLLLFDIDDFKLYNDTYGHQTGDRLLRRMGRTLGRSLRSMDIVARYGGDEFGIIMPEADRSTCRIFMDRLRDAIADTDFREPADEFDNRITISIGSATFPDDAADPERLIYCADMALLRSKAMGRNRSTVFEAALIEENS